MINSCLDSRLGVMSLMAMSKNTASRLPKSSVSRLHLKNTRVFAKTQSWEPFELELLNNWHNFIDNYFDLAMVKCELHFIYA